MTRHAIPEAFTGKDEGIKESDATPPQGGAVKRPRLPHSIACTECDGEGGWYRYGAYRHDPDSATRTWVECNECGGAGEFEAERDTECPFCLGDGMVTVPKWDVNGKEIECPCCNGYGMIAKDHANDPDT